MYSDISVVAIVHLPPLKKSQPAYRIKEHVLNTVGPRRVDWSSSHDEKPGGWRRYRLMRSRAAVEGYRSSRKGLQVMYHGAPLPFAAYHIQKDEFTAGVNPDRQAGTGAEDNPSVYITPSFATAEKYADYCVLTQTRDDASDEDYLNEAATWAIIIELDTYQALSLGSSRSYIRRLVDPKQAQLTAIWLRVVVQTSTQYATSDQYYLKSTALLPTLMHRNYTLESGIAKTSH